MTLKLPSAPSSDPTALTVRVAREAGGAAVGEAAGPQGSRPAPHTPAVSTGESGRQRPPFPQLPRPLPTWAAQVGERSRPLAWGLEQGSRPLLPSSLGPRHGLF